MNRSCKRCGASGSAVNHDAARCERCGETRAQDGEASGIIDVLAMTSLLASERSTVREASRVRPLGPGGARLGGPVAPAAASVDGLRPVTVRFDALAKKIKKTNLFAEIKIVAETPDYLVINKPAGLIVHPEPRVAEEMGVEETDKFGGLVGTNLSRNGGCG